MRHQNIPEEVQALPYIEREIDHRGRQRRDYAVFISMYFCQFVVLEREEKEDILIEKRIWIAGVDDFSVNSLLTPRNRTSQEIVKIVGEH